MNYMDKCVLITGVSGGMGLATAKKFISNGYKVYGLDVKVPDENLEGLTFIKTDLTKLEEVESAFNKVKDKLDAIINTAGIYDLNSLIEISEEDFIRIFNINIFSIYRVNKTFLPLLKENGRIVMVSSELAPLDPLPFTGLYAITKSTIEKYAYSLRMELQLLGYKVILIRPGAVDTGLIEISTNKLDKFTNTTTHYQCNAKKFKQIVDSVESKKVSPDKIANLIYKASNIKRPRYVYQINRNKGLLLLNMLPKSWQHKIIKNILKSK